MDKRMEILEDKFHKTIKKLESALLNDELRDIYIQLTAQAVILDEIMQEFKKLEREDEESEGELIWQ